jgi:spoIIIJ-associated protein
MEYEQFSAKTVDDAITAACEKLGVTSDKLDYEVIEEGAAGFLGIGSKQAVIKAAVAVVESSKEEKAKNFLKEVFAAMNMAVNVEASYDEAEKTMSVDLSGEDMGVLIGKRGQTLDSLQYLVSLVINKGNDDYIRVKVDTEDYRERRKTTLENLAKNIAFKVKRTKHSVSLEPMNPYERRIIHSALQNDKYVTTHSEGEEPYRHVIVSMKKYDRSSGRSSYGSSYDKSYSKSYDSEDKE